MLKSILAASLCLAIAASVSLSATAAEPLKQGERVVFLGDSITQQGAGKEGYVSQVKEALAKAGVEVIGAGISGNKVPDLEKRLDKDVLSKKPTLVCIYIGINDVWHSVRGNGTSKEKFESGLKHIIAEIQKNGGRVILFTPSVIGEKTDGTNQLDKMLDEYSTVSRKVAEETKSQLLDLRQAFVEHLKKNNEKNADKGILTTDGVHLNGAGNKFVAEQILAFLGADKEAAPAPKSTAAADAAPQGKLLRHVVLFKFKESVKPEEVKEVVDAFAQLPRKIDAIKEFEMGTDVGVENLAQGFTHGFVVTFADAKGRDAYLPHAAHEEFKKLAIPRIDKVLVFDYWVK